MLLQLTSYSNLQSCTYELNLRIIIGTYYLLDSLNIYWLSWLKWGVIWPVLVIIAGISLLMRRVRGE